MSRLKLLERSEEDGEERELRSFKTSSFETLFAFYEAGGKKAKQGGVMAGLLQGRESWLSPGSSRGGYRECRAEPFTHWRLIEKKNPHSLAPPFA